ncbi:MAG TPA: hypothetical protein VGH19_06580 [Verrucomicrobiae bacterium]
MEKNFQLGEKVYVMRCVRPGEGGLLCDLKYSEAIVVDAGGGCSSKLYCKDSGAVGFIHHSIIFRDPVTLMQVGIEQMKAMVAKQVDYIAAQEAKLKPYLPPQEKKEGE